MENTYKVYMHVTPNGKRYIGVTKTRLAKRWQRGLGYKCNEYFTNAIKKYGWDNIDHVVLFDNLNREEAEQKEIELIKQYKTTDREYGYNIEGGGSLRKEVSKETREKLRKNATGVIPSKETREKMGRAHSGTKCHFYGIPCTEEMKAKLRELRSKPVAQYDKQGNLIRTFKSATEAANFYGRKRQAITAACTGKSRTCAGYVWGWV